MPRRFHPIQFLPTLLSLIKRPLWWFYHFSGLRHIWEMAAARRPNEFHYEKSPTLVLWIIGLYVALYGIASTRYEAALDRVENRMGALSSQLSTSDEAAFKRLIEKIPRIQQRETPLEPDLLWPFRGHPLRAYFASCEKATGYLDSFARDAKDTKDLGKYFILQSLVCERRNPDILDWTKETIEIWSREPKEEGVAEEGKKKKGRLAGIDLTRVDLSGAYLLEADLSGAYLREADLSGAYLWKANLSGAYLERATLSRALLLEGDLSGAQLQGADLSRALLLEANLSGANIQNIQNWREIESINNANIFGIENTPKGFKTWARKRGAVEMTPEGWQAFRENKYREPEKWDLAR
uniref:Pentapeptide repeat-containing protein n=1 Tax=Candidatus Kentrum sp. LPFa TaxID=2126335 RepID=A0A450WXS9_9GAMM|nr:MAG: Pentapeptide repeat-containing protein [Candidatus Kentron sp. LPFa]